MRRLFAFVTTGLILGHAFAGSAWIGRIAPPVQEIANRVEITSPTDGDMLSGTVQITGTALDENFGYYQLDYAVDPNEDDQWFPVQAAVTQQVRESVLGAWDTTHVADGYYLIRLRLVRGDESLEDDIARVQVINATPTPLPTLPPTFTPTSEPGTSTPGPSPTPLIQQPPTRTPRPTRTPGGPSPTPDFARLEDSPFQPSRMGQAACMGVYITLGVFGFLAVYSLLRMAVRGQLRVAWFRFRREIITPLFRGKRRPRQD